MKIKATWALLACATFSFSVASAQLPAEVVTQFNQAAELIGAKNFAEAIPLLEAVVAEGALSDPEGDVTLQAQELLPQSYFSLAMGQASGGDFENAITNLDKADEWASMYNVMSVKSKIDNVFPKVYIAYGAPAFNSGDYAKAIEVFAKAYEKFPTNTDMTMLLAQSYGQSGDVAKATEIYTSIIALEGKHDKYAAPAAAAKTELANLILVGAQEAAAANDVAGVVAATEPILAFDPTNAMANMMRLQTANNAQDYDAVIGFGEAAATCQATPEDQSAAYFLLGAAYQNKDDKANAIAMYSKVTAGPNAAAAKAQIAELNK